MTSRCLLQGEQITDPAILNSEEAHQQQHGHPPPPLTDPDTECWMKWEQWNSGLLEKHQLDQIRDFDFLTGQALEWFLGDDTLFPSPPPPDASYETRQQYLIQCFSDALKIALPDRLDPPMREQQLTQTSLDCYRLLYQHLSLPDTSTTTRLLEILPGTQENSLIETRLFNANLEDLGVTHKYEALSYVWGTLPSQGDLRSIRVNGLTHQVTPNLYNALGALRFADQGRTLWVDSICINQGDLKERAQQVMLMAKIYAKADRTVIYLGPSTPDSVAFFNYLNLPICQPERFPGEAHAQAGISEQSVLDGFIDVCSREWWERLWILQEYTLSRTDPIFYCGSDAVSNSLFAKNFSNIYQWAMHRRKHPKPVDSCTHPLCNPDIPSKETDDATATDPPEVAPKDNASPNNGSLNEACAENSQLQSQGANDEQVKEPNSDQHKIRGERPSDHQTTETNYDDFWEGMGKHISQQQQRVGLEWSSWGQQVWKADAVFQRRSKCSSWHSPEYIYMALNAQCANPRDIVYGVRELMEPVFREIFPSDYTIPVPKLFTTLAAYLIKFNFWLDMFWHYPTQLRQTSLEDSSSLSTDFPSWVPDFTKPTHARDAEKTPTERVMLRTTTNVPQIIDRVLFMRGWLLDEIIMVLPLPSDDPFNVLQQVWYLERVYGCSMYTLIHEEEDDEPRESRSSFKSMILETGGITPYPSVGWATKYSDTLPHDISIVHFVEDLANFEGIPEAFTRIVEMTTDFVKRDFDRQGKPHGPSASPDAREEFWAQYDIVHGRVETLLEILMRKWTDFIGICTFDFEGLRAQVCHRLIPVIPQRPRPMYKPHFVGKGAEYICDPPLVNATLQRPFRYSYLLTEIVKGAESEEEVKLREDVVMCMARVIHDATVQVVGGQNEVTYVDLCDQDTDKDSDPEYYFSQSDTDKAARNSADKSTETEARQVVGDFMMMPLPTDIANGEHPDGPRTVVWGTMEELGTTKELDLFKPMRKRSRPTAEVLSNEATATCDAELELESPPHPKQPCGKDTRWRRIEKRTSPKPHLVLCDLVDFLSGREFFVTETGLIGLTGPGTQGVCEGDDLFLLQNMAFPLIGRLEPSEILGNPKKRRRDQSTSGMQREIIGTAIMRDIDATPSEDREIVLPAGFEPLSGLQPAHFRFK